MGFEFDEDQIRSIGAYLRKVREDRELTLEEVAAATRIHLRYLKAVEEDDDEQFPDPPYRDLFIKSYSEFLGVPAEEIILRLPESRPRSTAQKKTKAAGKLQKPTVVAKPVNEKEHPPLKPLPPFDRTRLYVYGGLFLVVVVVVIGYIVLTNGGEEQYTKPTSAGAITPAESVTTSMVAASGGPDSLYMLLTAERDCWLDVRADGSQVFSNTLREQDTVRFAVRDSLYFKVGKANAVAGYLNGMPLRLGEPGDSATAEFLITQDNYGSFVDSSKLVE